MNYIVNLFRSRQQDPTPRRPHRSPAEQLDAMQAMQVPDGPLLPAVHRADRRRLDPA